MITFSISFLIWEWKLPIATVVEGNRREPVSKPRPVHTLMSKRGNYLSLKTTPSASGGAIESWNGVLK